MTTIRTARPEERAALEALQWRASLAIPEDRDVLLANPDAIALPAALLHAGQVIVAEVDGSVAGFAVMAPRDDGDVALDGLFVEPGRWRSGIGRALVEAVVAAARAAGAGGITVIGGDAALPFYGALGFARTGTAETRFKPATILRRTIAARGAGTPPLS